MEDRSNIIKEAIEYRDKLEAKVKELEAENETLKSQLDFEVQKKEVLEAENERLTSCLQEIKEIAECNCGYCKNCRCPRMDNILDLITKAEEE